MLRPLTEILCLLGHIFGGVCKNSDFNKINLLTFDLLKVIFTIIFTFGYVFLKVILCDQK